MLVRTRHPLDRTFDRSLNSAFDQLTRSLLAPMTSGPVIDAAWHEGSLELTVDLPGTPAEAISVDVAGRQLTIAVDHDGRSWKRSLHLGPALDPDQVNARYVHGRLTVTAAAAVGPEPRSVAIDTAPPPAPAIEASSEESAQDSDSNDNG